MKSYALKGAFFAVLMVLVLLGGCKGEGDDKPKGGAAHGGGAMGARASNVRTWTAVSGDVPITIKAVGTLEAEEEVIVSAEVAGMVTDILKDEGASVKTGTVLSIIDRDKFRLDLATQNAEFEKATANLDFSEKDLARKTKLLTENMISQRDLDSAELKKRSDSATLESAVAGVALAEKKLKSSSVSAPFGGQIAERFVSKGSYVKVGAELFRLIDTKSVKVSAEVSESHISDIKVGQKVRIKLSSITKEYEGQIYYVSPDLDEGKRVFEIKVRVKNKDGLLKPGLFADIEVVTDVKKGVFAVPEKAVIVGESGGTLYVVKDGVAQERYLPVVERNGATILVGSDISGSNIIDEGEEVVVEGANKLKDGSKVKVVGR